MLFITICECVFFLLLLDGRCKDVPAGFYQREGEKTSVCIQALLDLIGLSLTKKYL